MVYRIVLHMCVILMHCSSYITLNLYCDEEYNATSKTAYRRHYPFKVKKKTVKRSLTTILLGLVSV